MTNAAGPRHPGTRRPGARGSSGCRSPRSCWRCCPPSSTRRSSPPPCRRSPRPRPPQRRLLARHRLRRRRDRLDPAVGQARRPPRAPRLLEVPLGLVPRGLGAVRRGPGHHAADRRARRPGRGRRRADDARDGGGRRPRLPARARPLPGLHRGDLRGRDRRSARWSAACWSSTSRGAGSSTSTCPSALAALAGLGALPAPAPGRRRQPLDLSGAALLAAPRARCCWPASGAATATPGARRASSASPARPSRLGAAFVVRERRAADPVVPLACCARRPSRVAGAGAVPGHGGAVRGHRLRARSSCRPRPARRRPRRACCSSR